MAKIHRSDAARRDLVDHFVYLADNANLETADRFLEQAEAGFGDLANQPMIGAAVTLRSPALAGLRKWRVRDFENHLVFYLPQPDGVLILRVLHGARDWWDLLGLA